MEAAKGGKRNRDKAAIVIALLTNLPTYQPTSACIIAMAVVVVIATYLPTCLPAYLPTCLPTCLPAYAVALTIKQAVIGRFHFEAFRIFTNRGGGEKSASIIQPS